MEKKKKKKEKEKKKKKKKKTKETTAHHQFRRGPDPPRVSAWVLLLLMVDKRKRRRRTERHLPHVTHVDEVLGDNQVGLVLVALLWLTLPVLFETSGGVSETHAHREKEGR